MPVRDAVEPVKTGGVGRRVIYGLIVHGNQQHIDKPLGLLVFIPERPRNGFGSGQRGKLYQADVERPDSRIGYNVQRDGQIPLITASIVSADVL